jgi:nucleotide-binding universal stress UspA family protein
MTEESINQESIVVGWSPDRYGEAAVRHALVEARQRQGRVVVINATRGDALVDDRFAGGGALDELEAELTAAGVPHEVRQSVGGDVADQVLAVADEVAAAFVVIGLRRRSPVGKLIMGSVAQRILLGAACPVHAVKPEEEAG